MSVADPGYYKVWKERLYANLQYDDSFHYNITTDPPNAHFILPVGRTEFSVRLRRGVAFCQAGFKGGNNTLPGPAGFGLLEKILMTQTNSGGSQIVQEIPLGTLFGGPVERGDSFMNIPFQWVAGEDMHFVLQNNNVRPVRLSITLFGRNLKCA